MNGFYGQSVLATEWTNFKFLVESLEADFINEEVMLEGLDFSKIKEKLKAVLEKIKKIFLKIVNFVKMRKNMIVSKLKTVNSNIKRALSKIKNKDATVIVYNISIDNSKLSIVNNTIKGLEDNVSKAEDILDEIPDIIMKDIKEEDVENVKKIKEELSKIKATDNVDMEAGKKAALEIFKVDGKEKVTGVDNINRKIDEYNDLIAEVNYSTSSDNEAMISNLGYEKLLDNDKKFLDDLISEESDKYPNAISFMKELITCDKIMLQIIDSCVKNETKLFNYYLSSFNKYQSNLISFMKDYDDFDDDFYYVDVDYDFR